MNGDLRAAAVAVVGATLLAGTIALAVARPILARRKVVDVPNQRSSHSKTTVRGGGVGIAVGLLVGLALAAWFLAISSNAMASVVAVGFTAAGLAAVGLIEDLFGLRVETRLQAQAFVLGCASIGLVLVEQVPLPLGVAVGLGGIFYVNAANFMDGVNGISSMHGAVVGSYFALVGYMTNHAALVLTGAAVGVAFISFLPWNAPRARMFMGDVGSYLLGGSVWALSAWAMVAGAPVTAAVAPLLIYAADVAFTLVGRAARGARLTQPHREHVYQRVQQSTGSHLASTAIATGATILSALLGLWNMLVPSATVWVTASLTVVAFAYLLLPRFLTQDQESPIGVER